MNITQFPEALLMRRLSEAQLLRGADEQSLHLIAETGEFLDVPANQRIIEEGAVPRRMFLLITGKLAVFIPDPADRGHGKRLASLKPGESCGEYGFIDRRPASASVKAMEDSEVFTIYNNEFDALLRADHELERIIYRNLLRTLVGRLRASNVVIDMLRSPEE